MQKCSIFALYARQRIIIKEQKGMTTRSVILAAVLSFLLSACSDRPPVNTELEGLKNKLFSHKTDVSELPIYADPPTADYEEFKKGIFSFQADSAEIEMIKKYRSELEPDILQRLDSGYAWVYLAAFLKYRSAVPEIKNLLLNCERFYGWEGPDYSKIESYLIDDIQYCYQMAYISAIEYITSEPIDKAVTITDNEFKELKAKSEKCTDTSIDSIDAYCSARWLLGKLKR